MSKAKAGEKQNARVFRRDNFKCAYCDLDMGTEATSVFLEMDHIDPDTKINTGDFGEEFDINKVTSCVACNRTFKHGYRPNGETREEKIQNAREYVRKKREEHFKWFRKVKAGLI